jgi:hypothetical protein
MKKHKFHNIDPEYDRRLRKHEKMIKMLNGKNLDYIYMLWGVPSYVPLHKRKVKS